MGCLFICGTRSIRKRLNGVGRLRTVFNACLKVFCDKLGGCLLVMLVIYGTFVIRIDIFISPSSLFANNMPIITTITLCLNSKVYYSNTHLAIIIITMRARVLFSVLPDRVCMSIMHMCSHCNQIKMTRLRRNMCYDVGRSD